MNNLVRWRFGVLAILIGALVILLLTASMVHAQSARRALGNKIAAEGSVDWAALQSILAESAEQPVSSVPQPDLDPCLHCHIAGEYSGIWTPVARWALFGTLGFVFVLGVYRSTTVWKRRTSAVFSGWRRDAASNGKISPSITPLFRTAISETQFTE